MDEHTWTQQTPYGSIQVSAGKDGVRSLRFDWQGAKSSAPQKDDSGDAVPAQFAKIAQRLERYFDGDAHALDDIDIDLSDLSNEFQRSVLTTLRGMIGPGQTISYGALAAAVGHPGAARAVGTVMATNPVPIIIPCHRVLASDGTLGGYGGGLDMKRELLRMEGAEVKESKQQRSPK
ncbi:MAG: MGMT family protein [Dehalococcoidia bacterium]